MSILNLLRLKILNLLSSRLLMIMLLILPILLGLMAGTANVANTQPDVRLAVVDQDHSAASEQLIAKLLEQGWSIQTVSAERATQMLLKREADGIVLVEAGYEASLADLDDTCLTYTAAEGSLVTNMVREAIAAEVMPAHSRLAYLERLAERYRQLGQPLPADLVEKFDADAAYFVAHEAALDVEYYGATVYQPALSYLVSDYSMEVFFLAIFAILGTLTLSNGAMRRRLITTRNGMLLDYCLSLVSLFLLGLVQVTLYALAMSTLMQVQIQLQDVGFLAVCLFVMLGVGQLLSLFHESLRLYLSLLVLLLLSVASGCFFQLSAQLVSSIGQYLPQGWALAGLRGFPVLPVYWPIMAGLILLAGGYLAQVYRTRRMR